MTPKKKTPLIQEFTKGIVVQNPVLRLVLGCCPALAVTTSVKNGIGMGLAATFVLVCSNLVISLLRKVIPDKVRIPAFITVISGFVTIAQLLLQAYLPSLNESLGIFVPLITVNCIILARAEIFASKNPVVPSIIDGLGMGVGFTAALFGMGAVREILGNGSFYDLAIPGLSAGGIFEPVLVFILPPGGFFVFGILIALADKLSKAYAKKNGTEPILCAGAINDQSACSICGGCSLGKGPAGETPMDRLERQAREREESRDVDQDNQPGGDLS